MSNVQMPVKPARAEPLLELMVDADKRGQVDARTPVRWCVGRPMLSKLEEVGFKNPYIVIVVRHRAPLSMYNEQFLVWRDTAIYACPLTQELQYINFKSAGRNDIRAFVVEMNSNTAAWLRVTRRNLGDVDTIFRDNGQLESTFARSRGNWYHTSHFDTGARVRVIVPQELFAPEPAPWRKNLVRAYGLRKGKDQCGFRKRFWFVALPLTVIGVPLMAYVPKLFALLFYTFFGRMPNKGFWRTAGNPLNLTGWSKALNGFSESKWWNGEQAIVLGVLNPPVLLILPSIVWCIMHLPFHHYHVKGHSHHSAWYPMSWPHVVMWVDGFIAAAIAAVAVIFGLAFLLMMVIEALAQRFPDKTDRLESFVTGLVSWSTGWAVSRKKQWRANAAKRRQERVQKARLELETELAAMTCRSEAQVVDLTALPKEKQTVHLRYNYIKTKVCRPFAA